MDNVLFAFGLTLFAGLSTGIGSIIAFTASKTNYRFLSVATGFSAGVMLYVAFVEIFLKSTNALVEAYGGYWGHWANAAAFFAGMLIIGIIDNVIPSEENPHTSPSEDETAPLQDRPGSESHQQTGTDAHPDHKKLLRMGLFTALAITIHNFPEGLATFLAAMHDPGLGIAIAVAVALHNIPEGISVSVPIYYATGDRKKAFLYSLASGFSEPIGALIGYVAIRAFITHDGEIPPDVMGWLFGGVAGIMVYISVDELLPTSRAYGKEHDSLLGLVAGMVVMALSLLLMK